MCSINKTHGKPFCAGGCPMPEGNTNCGETRTLDIINEFKRLYEQRMEEIDRTNCGDSLQEKIKLQQDWIGQLTEQTESLARVVEELEVESIERVRMLEEKLQKSAACICEVMKKYRENDVSARLLEEPRKRLFNLENDLTNVLEFIHRIRDEKQWSTGGLIFYEITEKDLLGSKKCGYEILNGPNNEYLDSDAIKERNKLKDQESNLHALERRVTQTECLSKELQCKREECESLQKNMVDMRLALTEEVATKHDAILKLKRECQDLEERCIQADKQTAFRDDIIKELRKEIKQLKQQVSFPEKPFPKDSDIIKKEIRGEYVLVINHTRKIVQNGKTTVIYLRHDSETSEKETKTVEVILNGPKNEEEFVKPHETSNEHTDNCSKCKLKLQNKEPSQNIGCTSEIGPFSSYRSESNFENYLNSLNKIKERSNLTMPSATLTRRNTFMTFSTENFKNSILQNKLKKNIVSVPNHVPVKMLIDNLEVNKTQ